MLPYITTDYADLPNTQTVHSNRHHTTQAKRTNSSNKISCIGVAECKERRAKETGGGQHASAEQRKTREINS